MHEAIARFTKNFARFDLDIEKMKLNIIGYFESAWQKCRPYIKRLRLSKQEINDFYDESVKMLIGWLKKHLSMGRKRIRSPESEVKLFSKKHRVMGIIDAIYNVNGRIYLVDYKTGKKDIVTDDIKVQMAIYALLYQENYKKMPHMVSINFLKTQTIRRFRITDKVIQYAINICERIHEKTISDVESNYPCTCGGWCTRDFIGEDGGH